MHLKKGTELELEIESLAFGAEGVARHEGIVVFVRGGLPGQRVKARIQLKKKSHLHARVLEVLRPSPDEITPRCEHFSDCGGCAIQNYDYAAQLIQKHQQVADVIHRIGKFEDVPVLPVISSPEQFFYRNKMEFTFSRQRWLSRQEIERAEKITNQDFSLGLNVRGFYDKTLSINECLLQSEFSNTLRNAVGEWCAETGIEPYSTRDHRGFWRFLVIREGKNTGEKMACLVTAPGKRDLVEKLAAFLQSKYPELTTFVHCINKTKAQVATGDTYITLFGPGFIHDKLGDFSFRISANSFFQTNTHGAEVLYQQVAAAAGLTGTETIYDFYCGAGTIGIYLSTKAKKIVGIEIVEQAIADAKINANLNEVKNTGFFCGDLKDLLKQKSEYFAANQPEVIVLDPPRAGLHPTVVDEVASFESATRMVYVSCNPATFARDAHMFAYKGFHLERVQPVDMFPHTAHIEVVGRFVRG